MKLYWNEYTEEVETKSSSENCQIIKGLDDRVVIESWWVDKERNLAINYAYTRDNLDRRSFFRSKNIDPDDDNLELRWLMLPKNEYEELMELYCGTEDSTESEG